jgi:hypothetical protein
MFESRRLYAGTYPECGNGKGILKSISGHTSKVTEANHDMRCSTITTSFVNEV